MPYAIEQKYFALGKETTRGTAVAPSKYIPVLKDTEFEYKLNLVPDELVRGIFERFPSHAGTKEGTAKISGIDVMSNNIGELLNSLYGKVTSSLVGPTNAYQHVFEKNNTTIQNPSYTVHINRGIGQKQYPLSVVKSIILKGTVDGKITADCTVLFKSENTEGFTLSPTWSEMKPFMFYQTTVSFDNTADLQTVKDWTVTIDNGSVYQRVLNNSQDVKDILTIGKINITGGMTVYFEDEARRTKFLNGDTTAIEIKAEGDTIETSYKHTIKITIPAAKYTAYPFGEVDGLLGAAVTFEGFYDLTTQKSSTVTLINTETSY